MGPRLGLRLRLRLAAGPEAAVTQHSAECQPAIDRRGFVWSRRGLRSARVSLFSFECKSGVRGGSPLGEQPTVSQPKAAATGLLVTGPTPCGVERVKMESIDAHTTGEMRHSRGRMTTATTATTAEQQQDERTEDFESASRYEGPATRVSAAGAAEDEGERPSRTPLERGGIHLIAPSARSSLAPFPSLRAEKLPSLARRAAVG